MSIAISPGDQVPQDPSDDVTYEFDWDTHLPAGVLLSASDVACTLVRPRSAPAPTTLDDSGSGLGLQTGSRTVKVRLAGLQVGARYTLTNTVTTDETPPQTRSRSFLVLCEEE